MSKSELEHHHQRQAQYSGFMTLPVCALLIVDTVTCGGVIPQASVFIALSQDHIPHHKKGPSCSGSPVTNWPVWASGAVDLLTFELLGVWKWHQSQGRSAHSGLHAFSNIQGLVHSLPQPHIFLISELLNIKQMWGNTGFKVGQTITHSSAVKSSFTLEIKIGSVANSKPCVFYINLNLCSETAQLSLLDCCTGSRWESVKDNLRVYFVQSTPST